MELLLFVGGIALIFWAITASTRTKNPAAARAELARWRGEAGEIRAARADYAALLPDMIRVLGADHPDTRAVQMRSDELARAAAEGIEPVARPGVVVIGGRGVPIGDYNTFG